MPSTMYVEPIAFETMPSSSTVSPTVSEEARLRCSEVGVNVTGMGSVLPGVPSIGAVVPRAVTTWPLLKLQSIGDAQAIPDAKPSPLIA